MKCIFQKCFLKSFTDYNDEFEICSLCKKNFPSISRIAARSAFTETTNDVSQPICRNAPDKGQPSAGWAKKTAAAEIQPFQVQLWIWLFAAVPDCVPICLLFVYSISAYYSSKQNSHRLSSSFFCKKSIFTKTVRVLQPTRRRNFYAYYFCLPVSLPIQLFRNLLVY